jgi:hypothetical protein
MTIAACYHSNEGVVLGTDSTVTVAPPNLKGFDIAIRHYNHTQKVFEVGSNCPIGPMGICVYGLGAMGQYSHRSLVADFAEDIEANPPNSMDEAAERWSQKVWDVFSGTFTIPMARAKELLAKASRTQEEEKEFRTLSQIGGGYFLGGRLSKVHTTFAYQVEYNACKSTKIPPVPIPVGSMSYAGCTNLMLRLINGYEPKIVDNLMATGKWSGSRDELIASMSSDQMFPDTILNIRDAVDLVYSMIHTTITGLRFSQSAALCGGPIEIACITTDRTFRWVIHKDLSVAVRRSLHNET